MGTMLFGITYLAKAPWIFKGFYQACIAISPIVRASMMPKNLSTKQSQSKLKRRAGRKRRGRQNGLYRGREMSASGGKPGKVSYGEVRLQGRWGKGASVFGGCEARRVISEGAADELNENCGCSGVMPGGLEVQGLGKGPSGVLTGGHRSNVCSVVDSVSFSRRGQSPGPGRCQLGWPGGKGQLASLE